VERERETVPVAKVIECAQARYEVQDVESGKVYKWRPERVVVECGCGERLYLNASMTSCKECSTDHAHTVRGERVKVLLSDDHTMFREGLARMLVSSYRDQVEVVGKTKIGEEGVALAQDKKPGVIIMQVDRTLKKAKDTLERMRREWSPPKVIILTMFEDPRLLREIMELGANAYIHKSASVEELFGVLRTTTLDTEGGHVVISMPQGTLELSKDGAGQDGAGEDGAGRELTRRELEILLLTARGMSNRQIASHLAIAEGTIKRHLANIYPKMDVGSRGEAVRVALENEWFTFREIEAEMDGG
jgi:DNA-binding NarL/FixJ family response regulator